jgi:hypothetical protein
MGTGSASPNVQPGLPCLGSAWGRGKTRARPRERVSSKAQIGVEDGPSLLRQMHRNRDGMARSAPKARCDPSRRGAHGGGRKAEPPHGRPSAANRSKVPGEQLRLGPLPRLSTALRLRSQLLWRATRQRSVTKEGPSASIWAALPSVPCGRIEHGPRTSAEHLGAGRRRCLVVRPAGRPPAPVPPTAPARRLPASGPGCRRAACAPPARSRSALPPPGHG